MPADPREYLRVILKFHRSSLPCILFAALVELINVPLHIPDLPGSGLDEIDDSLISPAFRRPAINPVHLAKLFVGVSLFYFFTHYRAAFDAEAKGHTRQKQDFRNAAPIMLRFCFRFAAVSCY